MFDFANDIEMGLIETVNPATNKIYSIIESIGKGGMGAVYRGLDTRTNKAVAIKVISPEDGEEVERWHRRRKRGMREAQGLITLTKAGQPGFPVIYNTMIDVEDRLCIVMELIPGHQLADLIKSHKLQKEHERIRGSLVPKQDFYAIAQQLFKMARTLQELEIVHRDIKPENIMWSKSADGSISIKMVDLGIAKMSQPQDIEKNLTQEKDTVGTLAYMAPEQFGKQGGKITHLVDLYAIGCVLYEMVTGQQTVDLEGRNGLAACVQTLSALEEPLPQEKYPSMLVDDMNIVLEELILGLLKRDPAERVQSAGEAEDRLVGAMAHDKLTFGGVNQASFKPSAISSSPPSGPSAPKAKVSSWAIGCAVIGIAAGIMVTIVAMLMWRGSFAPPLTASAAPSSSGSSIAVAAKPLLSAPRAPQSVASLPAKEPRPILQTRRDLAAKDLRDFEQAERVVKATKTPCGVRPTELNLVLISQNYERFPDPLWWLAECARRKSDPRKQETYLVAYETLRGNRDPP
jgi:serine/threonine protein kinase